MDDRDRVQQVALVDAVIGRAVQLERLQRASERLGEVAGVVVDDPDEVERPHLDDDGAAPCGRGRARRARSRTRRRPGPTRTRSLARRYSASASAAPSSLRVREHPRVLRHAPRRGEVGRFAGARRRRAARASSSRPPRPWRRPPPTTRSASPVHTSLHSLLTAACEEQESTEAIRVLRGSLCVEATDSGTSRSCERAACDRPGGRSRRVRDHPRSGRLAGT